MIKYIQRFKKSRTVRLAFFKALAGVVTIIIANLGYFESSFSAQAFGIITIVLAIVDHVLRVKTTESIK